MFEGCAARRPADWAVTLSTSPDPGGDGWNTGALDTVVARVAAVREPAGWDMSIDPLLQPRTGGSADGPPPRHSRPPRRPAGRRPGWPIAAGAACVAVLLLVWVALANRGADQLAVTASTAPTLPAPGVPPAGAVDVTPVATVPAATLPAATVPAVDPPAATDPPAAPAPAPTTAAPAPTAATPGTADIDTPGSDWWLVNPDRPLPDGYVPPELVTPRVPIKPAAVHTQAAPVVASAFEAMVAAALGDGHELQLTSGYRSYQEQQETYDRFVRDYGPDVAAERVAVPGTSEHQTGLAVDVGQVGLPDDQEFGDQASSAWVRDNAHRFGFVIRYPPDKAHITGYANEPWHLRYVGAELAAQLYSSGLTMEEHFGLVPAATG